MGIHLLDYLQFEKPADQCERAGRWEFLFVTAPLRIVGGTGSPLNPAALLIARAASLSTWGRGCRRADNESVTPLGSAGGSLAWLRSPGWDDAPSSGRPEHARSLNSATGRSPMTTAVESRPATGGGDGKPGTADVFVIFGITGDLAKVMTFHSLYRLERARAAELSDRRRGGQRLVGRGSAQPRARVRSRACGEQIDERGVRALRRAAVVRERRLRRRRRRTSGWREAIGDARTPGVLPRDPAVPVRARDQGADRRRADEDRARRGREAVRPRPRSRRARWPTRSTSTSTSRSSTGSTTSSGRWVSGRSSTCGSRTRCSSRSGIATTSRRSRSRWRRASGSRIAVTSTIRSARCGTWSSTT